MSKTPSAILRAVAALVIRRGLDGRTFPLAVERTQRRYGADAPNPVRKLAALVRFRHADATPTEVAALLVEEAEAMGGGGHQRLIWPATNCDRATSNNFGNILIAFAWLPGDSICMGSRYIEQKVLTEDAAKAILEPYMPGLQEDLEASWAWVQEALDGDPERRVVFDTSTQAAMVFNRFVFLTERRLSTDPKVRITKHGRMMKVAFGGGQLSLRFKKLDEELRSKNVKTNQQLRIYSQMVLDGMDPTTTVTFGYKLDPPGRNIVGVYITCPIGWNINKWVIVLSESEGDALLLAPQSPPDDGQPGFSIRPKERQRREGE